MKSRGKDGRGVFGQMLWKKRTADGKTIASMARGCRLTANQVWNMENGLLFPEKTDQIAITYKVDKEKAARKCAAARKSYRKKLKERRAERAYLRDCEVYLGVGNGCHRCGTGGRLARG